MLTAQSDAVHWAGEERRGEVNVRFGRLDLIDLPLERVLRRRRRRHRDGRGALRVAVSASTHMPSPGICTQTYHDGRRSLI